MSDAVVYENISEGATTSYTQQGWTATVIIKIDGVDDSNPDATLQNVIDSDMVPARGEDHPSGYQMQADEITCDAISSNQVVVTVKYKNLSAVEAEPSDTQPALMTFGSTAQSQQTSSDYTNQPLVTLYQSKDSNGFISGSPGSYTIQSTDDGSDISDPSNVATGDIQVPNTIIRFSRREPNPPGVKAKTYMTMTNATACSWGGVVYPTGTLLCTRIEGNTNDGGTSYIVEYEFQFNEDAWTLFSYYTLPNNTQGVDGAGAIVLGPGDIPPDCGLSLFQIYGTAEFNDLLLTGA